MYRLIISLHVHYIYYILILHYIYINFIEENLILKVILFPLKTTFISPNKGMRFMSLTTQR